MNRVLWGTKEDPDKAYLREQWYWLEPHLGPLPPGALLLDRCCAQFVVTRDRVRAVPLAFYQEALARAYAAAEAPSDASRKFGLLLEWLWHYVLGEPAANPEFEHLLPQLPGLDRVFFGDQPMRCAAPG